MFRAFFLIIAGLIGLSLLYLNFHSVSPEKITATASNQASSWITTTIQEQFSHWIEKMFTKAVEGN